MIIYNFQYHIEGKSLKLDLNFSIKSTERIADWFNRAVVFTANLTNAKIIAGYHRV